MTVFSAVASPALIIAVSAFFTILAARRKAKAFFFFKPVTTILIVRYALLALNGLEDRRGLLVIAGLGFALLGDIFLLYPKRFVLGLASFLVTHLCYSVAFFTGFSTTGIVFIALPLLLYAVGFYLFLLPKLSNLKFPVLIYTFSIILMVYQAAERYVALRDEASLIAFIGAILFMLSDSVLAINKFKRPFKQADAFVLATYYAAQWLIAFSLFIRFR